MALLSERANDVSTDKKLAVELLGRRLRSRFLFVSGRFFSSRIVPWSAALCRISSYSTRTCRIKLG